MGGGGGKGTRSNQIGRSRRGCQKRAVRNSVRLRRKWNQLSFGQWTRSGRIPVAWRQASKEKDRDNTIRTKRHLRPRLQSGSSAELFDRPLVARLSIPSRREVN